MVKTLWAVTAEEELCAVDKEEAKPRADKRTDSSVREADNVADSETDVRKVAS